MAEVFFENPPTLSGRSEDQLRQLQSYLYAMSGKLNEALMSISIEQMTPETRRVIVGASESGEADKQTKQKEYQTLKSLIIKTAEIVRHEMDEIYVQLNDKYEAISSQFGTYEETLINTITATAKGILQDYNYESRIQGLEEADGNTQSFMQRIDGYIFSGVIREEAGVPILGIAIGENITGYADGVPYMRDENKMATFTKDRLSFWQGDIEVAYYSNNVFYIAHGEITKELKMGNHKWEIMADGSMALISGETVGG